MAQVYPWAPEHVAKLKGVRSEVADKGRSIAARARSNLRAHRDEGDSAIRVQSQSPDYLVSLVDEAAGAIEFGGVKKNGTVVQGLFILTNAAH